MSQSCRFFSGLSGFWMKTPARAAGMHPSCPIIADPSSAALLVQLESAGTGQDQWAFSHPVPSSSQVILTPICLRRLAWMSWNCLCYFDINFASMCQTLLMWTFGHSDASVQLLTLGLCMGHPQGKEALLLEEISVLRAGWIQPKGAGRDFTLNCLLIPSCRMTGFSPSLGKEMFAFLSKADVWGICLWLFFLWLIL